MRVAQSRHCTVFVCKIAKCGNDGNKLAADVQQSIAVNHDIRIIRNIAACCAEVDNSGGIGAAFAVNMDMRHDVVAKLFFPFRNGGIVYFVINMRFKLRHLFIRYRKTETMLRAGKRNPKPAPCAVAFVRREEAQHVFRGISARKGAFVKFFHKLIVLQQFSGSPLIGGLSLPCPGRRKHSLCGSRFRVRRIQRICGHFREARHRCESLKCRSPNREV